MSLLNPFTVITEFRFDIGHAILDSEKLQGAANNLQTSIDGVTLSFAKMSAGFLVSNTGVGGLLSGFVSGIQAADKYQLTMLKFANLMSANRDKLTGPIETFNDRLMMSEVIMKNIAQQAQKFSLPGSDLMNMVTTVAPILFNKGMAGPNMSTAIDMSRNLLKSAPVLNVEPNEVMGQLQRMIGDSSGGQAHMGDTLFRRLVAETKAFSDLKGNVASAFNRLPEPDRIKRISAALQTFANDADVLAGRANSLTGQLQRLKQLFSPTEFVTNIFRPIGAVLGKSIIQILAVVNDKLNNEGRAAVENFAKILEIFTSDLRATAINILSIRDIKGTLGNASGILGLYAIYEVAHSLAKAGGYLAGGYLPLLGKAFTGIFSAMSWGWGAATKLVPILWAFAEGLTAVASAIMVPLGLALLAAHILSRAKAIAHIDDAKESPRILKEQSEVWLRIATAMNTLWKPFEDAMNWIAGMISPLYRWSYLMDRLTVGLNDVANILNAVIGTIQGLGAAAGSLFLDLSNGKLFGTGDRAMFAFMQEFTDHMERSWGLRGGIDGLPTAMQNINVGKVEIHNDFKENAEPDRIAFTIKEQLMKAAVNPTQARGRSFDFGASTNRTK